MLVLPVLPRWVRWLRRSVGVGDEDRLVKPAPVAERLALSLRTLDVLDEQGILPKVRILGAVRYRESDVRRVIREGAASRSEAA
jgi:predicted DNA-binding transcriptional regulator AlpA